MRHRVAGYQLSRTTDQRKALFRNLVRELYLHERIVTTEAKARAIRGDAERRGAGPDLFEYAALARHALPLRLRAGH